MKTLSGRMCGFGCGRRARFVLKMGKACCRKDARSCPEMRRKNSESHKGKCPKWKNGHPRGFKGRHSWNSGSTYEALVGDDGAHRIKDRIGNALAGRVLTEAQKMVLSKIAKQKGMGGYRRGGGRGKHGWYRGVWCDSSWELAWVMFHLDHGIPFERNRDRFEYEWQGEKHRYLPDFKMSDGTHVEIKAWLDEQGKTKLASCPGLIVLMKKDMEPFLGYAVEKYGKDFTTEYGRVR